MAHVVSPVVQGAHTSVWLDGPIDELTAAAPGDTACDVAIVGGGLAGLSTALHLKLLAPRLDVLVLEAGRIGYGQSGLNSGQCAPRIGPPIEKQVRALGAEFARAAHQYSLDAVELVRQVVTELAIDCEMQHAGQWQVALRDTDALQLENRAQVFSSLGFDLPLLSADAVRASLPDAHRIRNALVFPASTLNPARLCVGLKRAALAHGVRIHENTCVIRIERSTSALVTARGAVRASHVVLAVDGGIGKLGLLRRNVIPVAAFGARTRPLSEAERASIGWTDGQGIFDARPLFNFMRPLADGRLLIGGSYRFAGNNVIAPPLAARCTEELSEQLAMFFPSLRSVPFDARWHGLLGCTLNDWPIVAPLDLDCRHWHVGAWNGHGIALAMSAGRDLARTLAGLSPMPEVPWCCPRAPRVPGRLLARLLPLYLGWLRRSSRITY